MYRGGGSSDYSREPNLGSSYNNVGPPGYAGMEQIEKATKLVKRHRSEQDYFEDSDPEEGIGNAGNESDEDDPLDVFMAGIQAEIKSETEKPKEKSKKAKRQDIEDLDEMEEYMQYMIDNPNAGLNAPMDDEDYVEYDADGNPIIPEKSKIIDPLPDVDHSEIEYDSFNKNFYEEHQDIAKLSYHDVIDLRKKLGIKVSGADAAKPVSSFGHFGFDEQLMHYIRKSEFSSPTPIQAQGVPIAMGGRDIIGIAKTGSGKTAAFIWPLLIHIMDQKELQPGDGPIGLICAPTRELSQQIYIECKKFGKAYNMKVVCAYGGGNMWEQTKACQEGAEIIVCTPGRMIDLIKKKATNFQRVTFLVFDEADRMFDMGFEPQVRSIANHVRPDRQTLLFSATFRKRIERLARDILTDPVRVVQGDVGEANQDVEQIVKLLQEDYQKWKWLTSRLVSFMTVGSVLIFVTKKVNAEELATNLGKQDFIVGLLHGDMDQSSRNKVITGFKRKEFGVMVATDVAARGLDIPSIKTVINYDVARDIDTHTHRIGRTGRAGEKGTAYTLMTNKDVYFAGDLVRNLEGANQEVPSEVMDLAMQNNRFRKSRFKGGRGKRLNQGGGGLGYRERPGLGSSDDKEETKDEPEEVASAVKTKATGPLGERYGCSNTEGLYSSRLAAMKTSFSAQFKSQFQAASTGTNTLWTSKKGTVIPPKIEPILLKQNIATMPPPSFIPPSKIGGFISSVRNETSRSDSDRYDRRDRDRRRGRDDDRYDDRQERRRGQEDRYDHRRDDDYRREDRSRHDRGRERGDRDRSDRDRGDRDRGDRDRGDRDRRDNDRGSSNSRSYSYDNDKKHDERNSSRRSDNGRRHSSENESSISPPVSPTVQMTSPVLPTSSTTSPIITPSTTTPDMAHVMYPILGMNQFASQMVGKTSRWDSTETSTSSPGNDVGSMFVPSETSMLPPSGTSMLPPSGTSMLPPSGTSMLPPLPPSGTSMLPPLPPSGTSMLPPSGTSMLPPLPPSGTSMLPPLPPSGTSMLPPSSSSMLPPTGVPPPVKKVRKSRWDT
ncbi:ATP-dependent RNA helicase DDX42-like [Antedon mediterranea]|uniref:ATP-dependent RNA helicase DDX42-like n=1 Tax=Antedon mediterranea TaxID=105859 RepID=UPI003AF853ED